MTPAGSVANLVTVGVEGSDGVAETLAVTAGVTAKDCQDRKIKIMV